MKVMVVGLGSMGKRRIRLLKRYSDTLKIVGVDKKNNRRKECEKEYGLKCYEDIESCISIEQPSCAFVSTPPLSHNSLIWNCLSRQMHVFTEINLISDGYEENIRLSCEQNKVLFLSSTFLYRDEIKYIKNFCENEKQVFNYIYHVGQYLPDWHPWESYKDFFVNDIRTNGCREIFAIELPWIVHTFGPVKEFSVHKSKISSLAVNYPDNYLVTLIHENGNKGQLAVDIVSPKAVRNLEVLNDRSYLRWDGTPNGLYVYCKLSSSEENVQLYDKAEHQVGYSRTIIENAYYNEIKNFFAVIEGKQKPLYSFEQDREILGLIDLIES